MPAPRRAFDPSRGQYAANEVLSVLKERTGSLADSSLVSPDVLYHPRAKVIALVPADGYVRGMNFIFGLAEVGGRFGLVFLSRLSGSRPLFSERTLKEVLHELGHLMGLDHCPNPRCVMSFSNTLADTDAKEAAFCGECLSKISSWLRALPPVPRLP
ncbi:MAG: pentalenene synthase [Thermoproteota archaeon]|nr:MAG: pentalenene synthase [Candidatus Korarchaeota archaeon]